MYDDRRSPSAPRILVVEDEYLLANDLQSALEGEGYEVIGPFGNLSAGLDEAVSTRPSAAVLDISLHGEMVFPVLDRLKTLCVPVILATGYRKIGLPAQFHNYRVIAKPYTADQITRALKVAMQSEAI